MLHRFAGLQEGSLLNRFFAVRQIGTVAEYRARFEYLAASLVKVEEETMTAFFINGLNEKLRAELMVVNPTTLKETMEAVGQIETKNQILAMNPHPTHYKYTKSELPSFQPRNEPRTITWTPNKSPATTNQTTHSQNNLHNPRTQISFPSRNTTNTSENVNPRMKRLTPAEAQARKAQGFYY